MRRLPDYVKEFLSCHTSIGRADGRGLRDREWLDDRPDQARLVQPLANRPRASTYGSEDPDSEEVLHYWRRSPIASDAIIYL